MTNKINKLDISMTDWQEEQSAWNDRSSFFVTLHDRKDRKQQVVDFLAYVNEKKLLPSDKGTTLDIGCGVGDYSLGLAKEGYQATGIDLSDGMIKGAQQIAEKEHLPLSLYVAPWSEQTRQELGWQKQFDLAYSIFCPVMYDPDNLAALSKTSKSKCLWIAFSNRKDELVDLLTNHFWGPDNFSWQTQLQKGIDAIKSFGHNITITEKVTPEEEVFNLDAAVDYFALRLHNDSWGPMEKMKQEIKEILKNYLIDGKIKNKTEDTVAWVSWDV